jgi:hypothetical protein
MAEAALVFFRPRARRRTVRLVRVYLSGYFLLILGTLIALWYGDVLRHLSPVWVLASLVVALGFGIMLSISAGKPAARD